MGRVFPIARAVASSAAFRSRVGEALARLPRAHLGVIELWQRTKVAIRSAARLARNDLMLRCKGITPAVGRAPDPDVPPSEYLFARQALCATVARAILLGNSALLTNLAEIYPAVTSDLGVLPHSARLADPPGLTRTFASARLAYLDRMEEEDDAADDDLALNNST